MSRKICQLEDGHNWFLNYLHLKSIGIREWNRCIPLNLRSKTRQRATLLGLTSVDRKGRSTSYFHLWQSWRFHIFPFLVSNMPASPAYGDFISQLIRYARACSSYECFILRATRFSNKPFEQGYATERLKSSLKKCYGRYGDLIKQYEVPLMLNDIL